MASWWQRKLLQYGLARSGLFEDGAINLDDLNVSLGRRNVVELKDVALNLVRTAQLAKLPSHLRVETARILQLRLIIPSDLYSSGIEAEVDGIELTLELLPQEVEEVRGDKARERSPLAARSPQHRKMHRRIRSPAPYGCDGMDDNEVRIPTAEELAKSFLLEEPLQERRQLEASLAAEAKGLDESAISESSEGGDVGLGVGLGMPAFLAGFLQGVQDRLQVRIRNVAVELQTEIAPETTQAMPVTLRLKADLVELKPALEGAGAESRANKRSIEVKGVSLDLLSVSSVFSELSAVPSPTSPTSPRRSAPISVSGLDRSQVSSTASSIIENLRFDGQLDRVYEHAPLEASVASHTSEMPRHASVASQISDRTAELDIQAGDDNISWGSRRSKSSAPAEDLWNSMASEDNLPDSLLLDGAPTPRASPSRGVNPAADRIRRPVSPYDRGMRGPGSWPRPDESPDRRRLQQSPGSWPMLDKSQYGMFQPLTPGPTIEHGEHPMDNKRTAMLSSRLGQQSLDPNPTEMVEEDVSEDSLLEDMAQSRLYSHEEAQSLYMSAMSHDQNYQVPGEWGPGSLVRERSISPEILLSAHQEGTLPSPSYTVEQPEAAAVDDTGFPPANATPRAQTPERPASSDVDHRFESKRLLTLDRLAVWLPNHRSGVDDELQQPPAVQRPQMSQGMPGTFSAYADLAASRSRVDVSTSRPGRSTPDFGGFPGPTSSSHSHGQIEVQCGCVSTVFDLASCRMLYKAVALAFPSQLVTDHQVRKSSKTASKAPATSFSAAMLFAVESFEIALMEQLVPNGKANGDVPLFTLRATESTVIFEPSHTEVRIGRLQAWISGSELLSFDRSNNISGSLVLTDSTPDFLVSIADKATIQGRPVKDINIETLPVRVNVDLGAIDDTLGSFGGLSGVLELGNSFASEGTPLGSPKLPMKTVKGVRFAGDAGDIPGNTSAELKANARIAGLQIVLKGDACGVSLRTTTVKAVYRAQGAKATVEHIQLSAPIKGSQAEAPIAVDLVTLRLEYLMTPHEKDLERLLLLLTPPKDKYDNDDDILVDTLLRQRRKGAVARIAVGDAKINVANFESFEDLMALGGELSKLSAVAKYLPEDERPGLLSLVKVKSVEARLPVNETFGKLHLNAEDIHCAHVGLPPLLAVSIGNVVATREGTIEVLHPLLPLTGGDCLPMVMARMIGDEAEPTAKVKLFNTAVEYSVPIIVALTGDPTVTPEAIVADVAKSAAKMVTQNDPARSKDAVATKKRTNIDVLIHDSAIGLSPSKAQSKALVVLTDTEFGTTVPPEKAVTASLELRKAAIFVTDDREQEVDDTQAPSRNTASNTTTTARLSAALTQQGYASVASIMSGRVHVKMEDAIEGKSKSIDVDISNELFLLESCADSTQTLFAILGGLAPPAAPSKQPKYLTEPMTIEDMMASFTGEPIVERQASPDTLFDADKESRAGEEDDMLLGVSNLGEDEDALLASMEVEGSLYGPLGSALAFDEPEADDQAEEYPETTESLLEDDPFEMTISPSDAPMDDSALARDLQGQCKQTVIDEAAELGLNEYDDLGFEGLGAEGVPLGAATSLNAPGTRQLQRRAPSAKDRLPFRLRIHDTHVIWNLYDGYDWRCTRDGITEAVEQVEARAEERKSRRIRSHTVEEDEESVIRDFLFNSIYIGVPGTHDAEELRRQINRDIDDLASETESVPMSGMSRPTAYSASGRPIRQRQRRRLKLERGRAHKLAFELQGVSADVLVYPAEASDLVSLLDLRVRNFEIFDNVPTSTWRKFLTSLEDSPNSRELAKPIVHVEVHNVRTLQDFAASELIIHVSVLPLRLHVDQDALDFVARFFEFKDERIVTPSDPAEQPFIQRLEVETVDMCLDYKPKRIDYAGLRSGHTTELMNLITLDATNIKLRHAIVYGIRGFEPIHKTLNDIWMPDIKRNQLPTVLAGLAPVRSLVNIGSGVRDVVAIPIKEYRKDGRIVRSIQKGALRFGKTTTSELARLGAKLAIGTQNILTGAEGMLSPTSASPSTRPGVGRRVSAEQDWQDLDEGDEEREQRAISAYANQPIGVLSGLRSARMHLERDLLTARDAFIAVQGELLDSRNPGSAVAAVARHAPTVILRPVIGASRAVGTTLLGVGNQIDRQNMRRIEDVSIFCSAIQHHADTLCRNTSGDE